MLPVRRARESGFPQVKECPPEEDHAAQREANRRRHGRLQRASCELQRDACSPTPIDSAPATSPASPAIRIPFELLCAVATSSIKPEIDSTSSLPPVSAAKLDADVERLDYSTF